MSQTRPNKIVTITNDEVYDLSTHLARMADSASVVVPVNTVGERDAITKFIGLTVRRLDVTGAPLEAWNGTSWDRSELVTSAAAVPDAFFTVTGGMIKTVSPTGFTQVSLTLTMVRLTAAIVIGTGDTAVVNNLIPAGMRPTNNHYFTCTINTNTGTRYAEPQMVIGDASNGTLVGRSVSGGPITVGVGYVMYLSTTWFL
jgi:hypothetical protein